MLQCTTARYFKGFDVSKGLSSLFGSKTQCCSTGCNPKSTEGASLLNEGSNFGSFSTKLPTTFFNGFLSGSQRSSSFGGGRGPEGGNGGGPFGGLFDKALEWCSEAHARDIARRQGINIREVRFEHTPQGGINVFVDAPNATPKQIEQLGQQVMVECPVARFRKTQVTSSQQTVQWLRLPDRYDR
ncbi:peroxiredoxin-like protein [Trypanosoma rangeli]|uniref:Peroxiredoxin-like protein n=1 Tax=Trypanosoma rangeli TaxID=5698 RepID=A0A3R7K630_TRYRA|nr:peroxiredoxin-like protein [Trypanosoma rangeli]RNF02337.1 peroxiredoxin-like protein [Trypanosoma rangeli]|eukprot:RNF02337.1 peroxiredoxin-like protein [Trypanosoma rangeli]